MALPINPAMTIGGGGEWSIGGVGGLDTPSGTAGATGTDGTQAGAGGGFGKMLTNAIDGLQNQQVEASQASQSLIDGTATDPSQVVMAVERARLGMQLAGQIRTKAVEAYSDIFHTQV
jgi:flagellar hook-basal body complex protein FliE